MPFQTAASFASATPSSAPDDVTAGSGEGGVGFQAQEDDREAQGVAGPTPKVQRKKSKKKKGAVGAIALILRTTCLLGLGYILVISGSGLPWNNLHLEDGFKRALHQS